MKKLAAILAMGILLFNLLGYRAVFSYLETHYSQKLDARLDVDHYDASALVTIKVPVDELPYYTNSPIFERVKGEVMIGGMKYQYVERRIYNDSLEMRCIPNAEAHHITNARDEFFQLVNDLQHTNSTGNQTGKQSVSIKNILTECVESMAIAAFTPVFRETGIIYNDYLVNLPAGIKHSSEQPPDA